MKIKLNIVSILILFMVICGVNAQELNWNITGAGARAAGFSGAFIGVADDATAVSWNPAGLTQLERPEISIVGRTVSDYWEYIDGDSSIWDEEDTFDHNLLNFGSAALPLTLGGKKIVLAAAYQRQLDLAWNEAAHEWEDEYWDNWTGQGDYDFEQSYWEENDRYKSVGGGDTYTLGLAARLTPILSLGFSTNIWLGSAEETYTDTSFSWYEEGYYDEALDEFVWEYSYYDYVAYREEWVDDFLGMNFIIGAMLDLGGLKAPLPLKIGLSVRTPFNLVVEEHVEVSAEGYEDEYFWEDDYFTNSYADTSFEYDEKIEIEMPLMVGLGLSYRVGEFLTLAADFEYRAFGSSKIAFEEDGESYKEPLNPAEKDLIEFRVGAEYLMVTDLGVFPLRAGFKTLPTLEVSADYTYEDDGDDVYSGITQAVGAGFSLGTGYIMSFMAIDVTYSLQWYEYYERDLVEDVEYWDYIDTSTLTVSGIFYF